MTGLTLAQLKKLFATVTSKSDTLKVEMQAVVFDADVHLDNVTSGGAKDPVHGDFVVQSRKMLGYVQIAPSSILVPAHIFADLLNFQNGSLGGPVDCIIDIANSKQTMRIGRVDVNPAFDAAGRNIFVSAARGSLILPKDGSWSVVKQQTDTGDVKPVEEGQSVPLIKPNGTAELQNRQSRRRRGAHASKVNFGVLQSTGTQKLLFNIPQFSPGEAKLKSDETYFADAYKLLNAKSVFPNIANALQLTNAEKEVAILGEGLMQMADRTSVSPLFCRATITISSTSPISSRSMRSTRTRRHRRQADARHRFDGSPGRPGGRPRFPASASSSISALSRS